MIEAKLEFDECGTREELDELLSLFFKDKHYHLELGASQKVSSSGGFHASIRSARSKASGVGGSTYIELLRRCYPQRMTHFTGMKKLGNTWWAAVVELSDPTNKISLGGMVENESHLALLTGWTTAKRGTSGSVVIVRSLELPDAATDVMSSYEEAVDAKAGRDYEILWSLEPEEEFEDVLELGNPGLPDVKIPGLGAPKPRTAASALLDDDDDDPPKKRPPLKKVATTPASGASAGTAASSGTPTPSGTSTSVGITAGTSESYSEEPKEAPKPTPKKKSKMSAEKAALRTKMRNRRKKSDW